MDLGTKLQKLAESDSTALTAAEALYAATVGGALALGLGRVTGSLDEGKSADVVLVSAELPHMQPLHDPVSQLVYSAQGQEVDTVLCEGRILLEGGKFRTLDPKSVYKKAESWRKKIQRSLEAIR
jgi:5-methylthioadenosine/S-adenosylhomocysteine deaminase